MATLPGTPKTWTAGSVLTAADLNAEVRDSLSFLSDKPRAKVRIDAAGGNSTGYAVANSTTTTLPFDEEVYDTDSLHDNTTNNERLTLVRAGLWLVTASIQFESDSTGYRIGNIRLNGSTTIAACSTNALNGAATTLNFSVHHYASGTTDYVEARAFQTSGGSLDVAQSAQGTWFAAVWVGE